MVQAKVNRTLIVGRVDEISDATLPGFATAVVNVEQVEAVPEYSNMFEWANGKTIELLLPLERVSALGLKQNDRISCMIQKTGAHSIHADADTVKIA